MSLQNAKYQLKSIAEKMIKTLKTYWHEQCSPSEMIIFKKNIIVQESVDPNMDVLIEGICSDKTSMMVVINDCGKKKYENLNSFFKEPYVLIRMLRYIESQEYYIQEYSPLI